MTEGLLATDTPKPWVEQADLAQHLDRGVAAQNHLDAVRARIRAQ